jgi:hypothetical protein
MATRKLSLNSCNTANPFQHFLFRDDGMGQTEVQIDAHGGTGKICLGITGKPKEALFANPVVVNCDGHDAMTQWKKIEGGSPTPAHPPQGPSCPAGMYDASGGKYTYLGCANNCAGGNKG